MSLFLHFKGQRCSGEKYSKKRITGIAASNDLRENHNVCDGQVWQTKILQACTKSLFVDSDYFFKK